MSKLMRCFVKCDRTIRPWTGAARWLIGGFLLSLMFVAPVLAGRLDHPKLSILRDKGFDSTLYSGVTCTSISAKRFLASAFVQGRSNHLAVEERANDLDDAVIEKLQTGLVPYESNWKGEHPLYLSVVLTDLVSGKHGTVTYEFHFRSGNVEVAALRLRLSQKGGGLSDLTGAKHRARIPGKIVEILEKFFAAYDRSNKGKNIWGRSIEVGPAASGRYGE